MRKSRAAGIAIAIVGLGAACAAIWTGGWSLLIVTGMAAIALRRS